MRYKRIRFLLDNLMIQVIRLTKKNENTGDEVIEQVSAMADETNKISANVMETWNVVKTINETTIKKPQSTFLYFKIVKYIQWH